jgi:RecA-family ATPase
MNDDSGERRSMIGDFSLTADEMGAVSLQVTRWHKYKTRPKGAVVIRPAGATKLPDEIVAALKSRGLPTESAPVLANDEELKPRGGRKAARGEATDGPQDENDIDRERRDIAQRIVSAAQLAYDSEPQRDYVADGLILADNLTLVTGRGGIGKTRIMLQLGVAMQIDGEWLGMKVTQGPVLFVTSEESRDDVHLALRAILKAAGKSLANCPNLHILPLADRDATMADAPSKLAPLAPTPLWRALEEKIERLKPRVLFLDALADLFGGEENFRRHVRGFIVLLKRLALKHKLAVILIAHPSLTGMNTGSGISGSTDWHNGPRGRLFVEEAKDKDGKPLADKRRRIVTVMKAQHSEMEGTVFHLRWDKGAYVYERKDGGSTPYDRAAAAANAEAVFLALLQAFEQQGRSVSPSPSNNYAPSVFEKEEDADGISKTALRRAMSKLLTDGRIHIEIFGPPSKQSKKLALGPAPDKEPAKEKEPEGEVK